MKKCIKLVLLIAMMSLIFYFSSQVADESTVTTNGVIDIIYNAYHYIFKDNALSINEFTLKFFTPIRKLAHFSEFGLLGILAYINIKEYINKHHVLYSIIFSGLYAISDEVHQIFVPGRGCTLMDMLIDTSGATFAILLIHLISKKCLKK